MRRGSMIALASLVLILVAGAVMFAAGGDESSAPSTERSTDTASSEPSPVLICAVAGSTLLLSAMAAALVLSTRRRGGAPGVVIPTWLQGMVRVRRAGELTQAASPAGGGNLPRARLLMRAGDLPGALAEYEALIRASRELDAVIDDLRAALEVHPDHQRLRLTLAGAYQHDGQDEQARELFR